MSEVVTFIPDAGGSIVINGKCFFIKISLISGISDTKNWSKKRKSIYRFSSVYW